MRPINPNVLNINSNRNIVIIQKYNKLYVLAVSNVSNVKKYVPRLKKLAIICNKQMVSGNDVNNRLTKCTAAINIIFLLGTDSVKIRERRNEIVPINASLTFFNDIG